MKDEIVLYQPNEQFQLEVQLKDETVWLSQDQMALLFQRDKSVIARHISNIYSEGELQKESTVAKFAIVPEKRERLYEVTLYHCGHSVKDLGKKLSAIMRMDWNPETVLKEVR
jgi:hypothetical protein